MAAPPSQTLSTLSGIYKLNKSLSTIPIDRILSIQGTSSLVCKTIASASVTLTITQPKNGEYHIKQTATAAAILGTSEQYILDNEWRVNSDAFFGKVRGRARWVSIEEGKGIEGINGGGWEDSDGDKLVLAEGGSEDGTWQAVRIWGLEEVGGDGGGGERGRRYTQSVKVWNRQGEEVRGKMVYDYASQG